MLKQQTSQAEIDAFKQRYEMVDCPELKARIPERDCLARHREACRKSEPGQLEICKGCKLGMDRTRDSRGVQPDSDNRCAFAGCTNPRAMSLGHLSKAMPRQWCNRHCNPAVRRYDSVRVDNADVFLPNQALLLLKG